MQVPVRLDRNHSLYTMYKMILKEMTDTFSGQFENVKMHLFIYLDTCRYLYNMISNHTYRNTGSDFNLAFEDISNIATLLILFRFYSMH